MCAKETTSGDTAKCVCATPRYGIVLIKKRAKTVVGVADLVGIVPNLALSDLKANFDKHRVPADGIDDGFKHKTAWVLERAQPLCHPYHTAILLAP